MERVLPNELSKFLIIIGIGVLSLSALLARKVGKVKESFQPHQKATAWYLLLSLFSFAIAACAQWFFPKAVNYLTHSILYQAFFMLLGIVHIPLMHHYLKWSREENSFWFEVFFTIILAMFGSIGFAVVFRQFNKEGFELLMASGIFLFVIPLLFTETFTRAINIPPRILKHWFYPVHEQFQEPDESISKNLLIISFEFQKHSSDTLFSNFRVKAPTEMDFGQLFYFFINEYHERHPNAKIECMNEGGEPYGWIFYKKPRWYTFKTHYINTDNTIYSNRIRENDVIICSRSLN
jgi:hypothetical protein